MRAARFEINVALLQQALHMPATSTIVRIDMEEGGWTATVTAEDTALPEAPGPHVTQPTCTEHHIEWDWGVK